VKQKKCKNANAFCKVLSKEMATHVRHQLQKCVLPETLHPVLSSKGRSVHAPKSDAFRHTETLGATFSSEDPDRICARLQLVTTPPTTTTKANKAVGIMTTTRAKSPPVQAQLIVASFRGLLDPMLRAVQFASASPLLQHRLRQHRVAARGPSDTSAKPLVW
jgi:hypothetical protein